MCVAKIPLLLVLWLSCCFKGNPFALKKCCYQGRYAGISQSSPLVDSYFPYQSNNASVDSVKGTAASSRPSSFVHDYLKQAIAGVIPVRSYVALRGNWPQKVKGKTCKSYWTSVWQWRVGEPEGANLLVNFVVLKGIFDHATGCDVYMGIHNTGLEEEPSYPCARLNAYALASNLPSSNWEVDIWEAGMRRIADFPPIGQNVGGSKKVSFSVYKKSTSHYSPDVQVPPPAVNSAYDRENRPFDGFYCFDRYVFRPCERKCYYGQCGEDHWITSHASGTFIISDRNLREH
jgi:hypothetical protein